MRRRRLPRDLALGTALALTLTACGGTSVQVTVLGADQARTEVAPADAAALPDLVAAADALGLAMLTAAGDGTTVTSPASLQVTLSMATEGAEGTTRAELEALVGATGADRTDGMNALVASLDDLDGDPAVVTEDELPETPVVHRAGRLLLDDSLTVRTPFVEVLARSYGAPAETTDLADDGAQEVLDAWAREHTGGLVPRSAISPGPELRLVLQDAVVLAARWEQPFLPELTQPHPFTLASGEEVEVDMMSGGTLELLHVEADGWHAVRLPYTGGRLHADVLLPPEGTAVTSLDAEHLEELLAGLVSDERVPVLLRMPRVEARSTLDLLPFLTDRAPAALQGGFAGISDEELQVTQLVQQGVLVVDEEGTLAAAVTEMGMGGSAPVETPLELVVDRPYLVRIADGETGWPLFVAHVADPRGD